MDFSYVHIRYFIGYVYHICLQDTIQSTLSLCLRCQALLLPMPLRPLLLTTRSGFTGASGGGAVFTSASSFLVSIFSHPSAYICLYSAHWMYGAGLLPVRRDRLPLATRKVYSGFSTVFLLLLLLAVAVGFPAACFWR